MSLTKFMKITAYYWRFLKIVPWPCLSSYYIDFHTINSGEGAYNAIKISELLVIVGLQYEGVK